MLNGFNSTKQHLHANRNEERDSNLSLQMESSLNSLSKVEQTSHHESNKIINSSLSRTTSHNSTSRTPIDDQLFMVQRSPEHMNQQSTHYPQQQQQHHHHQQLQLHPHDNSFSDSEHNFISLETSSSSIYNSSIRSNCSTTLTALTPNFVNSNKLKVKTENQSLAESGIMNASSMHSNMIPSAHGSEQSATQYSVPVSIKNSTEVNSSSIALNFSHDLMHQTSNHNNHSAGMPQHSDSSDIKTQLTQSFELDSGSLMQTAAVGMNMWKNTMNLNHFKHPAIVDHNFLPNSEFNSFPSWPHGNNLSHQNPGMTHHILDSQHLISYSQHQRSLPMPGQDLVGSTIKGQSAAEQQAFMLNTINHQASTSQNSSSNHQTNQTVDNLNLRSHPLDHSASSYNLSMNDKQFYNSSRSESRSHPNTIKSSFFAADRVVHMSLNNHQNQISYLNSEHTTLQPTTSQHMAGSSSSGTTSSKSTGSGSFACPTCNEVFPLRTVYQAHLKTHSKDKVSKAKFQCELCGHSFSQKTSLNRHMKSHTGERPFPCEICNKAFSEKERLKIHMRTHTGEKPFSCGICGKSFSQKSTVKRHQTVHTGEKKFRCDCGKGFANRGNLIAHIKTRGANHFE